MKLEMRHWLVGDQPNGDPWPSTGGVVDVDDEDLVGRLLASGAAVPVAGDAPAPVADQVLDALEPAEVAKVVAAGSDLTTGSVADVIGRVGTDTVLAQAVLDQEREKPRPRKGVIEQLEAVLTEDRCSE